MPVDVPTLECEEAPKLGQPRPSVELASKARPVCGYRIGELLGKGGMSVVFAVTHETTLQSFAMKVIIHPRLQDELAYETIHRHAKAIATLQSRHIVRTIDAGRLPSREPFIVMERLDGEDLGARVAREGALPISEAVGLLIQACDGLTEAHAAGIIHGDIKPGNLLVVDDHFDLPCLKIVDFAPAVPRAANPNDPLVTCSPGYASPEQLGARPDVDVRADVWALGAVLYELVAGHRAFDAKSLTDMLRAMERSPENLTSPLGEVPPALEAIVRRCLAHDREKRFSSVVDLRAALALVDRELVAAPAKAVAPRIRRRSSPKTAKIAHTLLLAALGPASALVSMTAVRLLLAFLH